MKPTRVIAAITDNGSTRPFTLEEIAEFRRLNGEWELRRRDSNPRPTRCLERAGSLRKCNQPLCHAAAQVE